MRLTRTCGCDRRGRGAVVATAAEMRARDVLDALERIDLFRTQATDSHRPVEKNIGVDLDIATSLLDLRQSREAVDSVGTRAFLSIVGLSFTYNGFCVLCVFSRQLDSGGERERDKETRRHIID